MRRKTVQVQDDDKEEDEEEEKDEGKIRLLSSPHRQQMSPTEQDTPPIENAAGAFPNGDLRYPT